MRPFVSKSPQIMSPKFRKFSQTKPWSKPSVNINSANTLALSNNVVLIDTLLINRNMSEDCQCVISSDNCGVRVLVLSHTTGCLYTSLGVNRFCQCVSDVIRRFGSERIRINGVCDEDK